MGAISLLLAGVPSLVMPAGLWLCVSTHDLTLDGSEDEYVCAVLNINVGASPSIDL